MTDTKGLGFASFQFYFKRTLDTDVTVCEETNEETLVLGIKNVVLRTLH
ncbi:hypothetical protein [Paenibacillus amylolyticus]|nr:hypothetical protein [Paenibacillus amylolyticus]